MNPRRICDVVSGVVHLLLSASRSRRVITLREANKRRSQPKRKWPLDLLLGSAPHAAKIIPAPIIDAIVNRISRVTGGAFLPMRTELEYHRSAPAKRSRPDRQQYSRTAGYWFASLYSIREISANFGAGARRFGSRFQELCMEATSLAPRSRCI